MGCGCGGRKVEYQVYDKARNKVGAPVPTTSQALAMIRASGGGTYKAVPKKG